MSNQEKPEQKKDTVNSNAKETKFPFSDEDLDSKGIVFESVIATTGSDDSQPSDSKGKNDLRIGNCPACGFPRQHELNANRTHAPNIGICPVCHNELKITENGYFIVYQDKNDHFDIAFQWIPSENATDTPTEKLTQIPVAKQKLFEKIITANTIIKSLYFNEDTETDETDQDANNAIKKKYFKKLLSLAQAGLAGEMAQPALATSALERLKDEITTVEGQRIKNTYMKELGLRAFLSSLIAIMIFLMTTTAIFPDHAALADIFFRKPNKLVFFESGFLSVLSMCSVIWIGAMLGTWVSFAARNPAFDFERLSILETDRMEPTIRLIYIGICAIIFSLLLSSGIVALEVGGLSTANIIDSISTQFVIGLLCGLTESKIGSFIHTKAEKAILNNQTDAVKPEEGQPAK